MSPTTPITSPQKVMYRTNPYTPINGISNYIQEPPRVLRGWVEILYSENTTNGTNDFAAY